MDNLHITKLIQYEVMMAGFTPSDIDVTVRTVGGRFKGCTFSATIDGEGHVAGEGDSEEDVLAAVGRGLNRYLNAKIAEQEEVACYEQEN